MVVLPLALGPVKSKTFPELKTIPLSIPRLEFTPLKKPYDEAIDLLEDLGCDCK